MRSPYIQLITNYHLLITELLVPFVRRPHLHISESGRRRAVACSHGLHKLAFAAVWSAPKRPLVAGADGVHGIPEFRSNPGIGRILQHAAQFAAFDFPANLASKLEVVALIVNRPGVVGLHENT